MCATSFSAPAVIRVSSHALGSSDPGGPPSVYEAHTTENFNTIAPARVSRTFSEPALDLFCSEPPF
jgi:hypothetical protein